MNPSIINNTVKS